MTGVNNAAPLWVGGKSDCGSLITCDYYVGMVDYLRLYQGASLDNKAPNAAFTSDCTANDGNCTFRAADSSDPDGSIATYDWSWTNNGVFEDAGVNPTHDFVNPGTYSVKLRVTDDEGATDSAVHPVTVLTGMPPSRPRQPVAKAGDLAARVSWKPPALDGDGVRTGYTVTSFPDGQTCAAGPADLTCHMTGLSAGTSYTFRVRAESTVGPSANSKETNTVTPFGKPGAPARVTAEAGNHRAKVTWTTAKPNGKVVSSYVVTRFPGRVKRSVDGSARSAVFKNLKNGHAYHFTVAGVNAAGRGEATASRNVTPAGVPTKVTHVTAKGLNSSALVNWAAAKPNGSKVLHYRIDSSDGQHRVVGGNVLKVRVKFLKPGDSYKFRVRAVNTAGQGPWSAWTDSVKVH